MNLYAIDYTIIITLTLVLIVSAYTSRRYTQSVAGFLAANRCAGRYVLGVAEGISAVGAISIVAMFEAFYKSGFSFAWWGLTLSVVTVVISLSGWIQYRYRQTRALTLAQFFEMRYNKPFRVFSGLVMFTSGMINFGIFPAVGARFFIYFCGFPKYEVKLGFISVDIVFLAVMVFLLSLSLSFTFYGQIAVIVTDFIQGTFVNIVLCIVVILIFVKVPWNYFVEAMQSAREGESMLNPLRSTRTSDFNLWYYVIQAVGVWFTFMAWQGSQGYYVSAINAHEARMGRVFGSWRLTTQQLIIPIIAIAAFVIMHHPDLSLISGEVSRVLSQIDNQTIRTQVTTTVVLSEFLPRGLLGAFCAVMLAAFLSTHSTYLHSWGSMFIQDVVMPLRKKKKRLSPQEHIKWLRFSIILVAVFILLFSQFFAQKEYIYMFFAMTGNIWLGGAGAVIVGGLYWKRGTTAGAFSAVILSVIITVVYFTGKRMGLSWSFAGKNINEQWLWAITMVTTLMVYIAASLITCKKPFNMDKLLNRGKYALETDKTIVTDTKIPRLLRVLGINRDFTFRDKIVYLFITGWTFAWAGIFIFGTVFGLLNPQINELSWAKFWKVYVNISLVVAIATTIWFSFGGIFDLIKMYKRLSVAKIDDNDDGSVFKDGSQD
jgi:solute:Na+ symporter, SSS family